MTATLRYPRESACLLLKCERGLLVSETRQAAEPRGAARAEHLWNIPAHRRAWVQVGRAEGAYGQLYQRFCHFLETDAVYLLNDAMQTLPKGAVPWLLLTSPSTHRRAARLVPFGNPC